MGEGIRDGLAVLRNRFPNLPVETRYVANCDEATLRSVERGIGFFMAFWSGTSFQSLRRLIDVLDERKGVAIELVIFDVDGSETLYGLPEFEALGSRFGGNGETVWLRRGKVVAMTWGAHDQRSDYRKNLLLLTSLD